MKINCPQCSQTMAVADEFAGRRVKCPSCQLVLLVPDIVDAVAVSAGSSSRAATPDYCPECGEMLAAGSSTCRRCRKSATITAIKVAAAPEKEIAGADGAMGGCDVRIRRDEVDLNEAIEKRLTKFIASEQLNLQIVDDESEAPDEPGPGDLVITGRVEVCEYGDRMMRYFLTFIAMFGPGSCRLEVDADAETAEGGAIDLRSSARQWMGIFGGSGDDLMKQNINVVATRIATESVRHYAGRRFLNAQAYSCANWSLGLGIASLIPFAGVLLGIIGLVVGSIGLTTIHRRDLPRGKTRAIFGIVLPFIGFVGTAVCVWLAARK